MANKSKHRRARARQSSPRPGSAPSNSSEVVTVAWMLSLLSTFTAELVGILIRLGMLRYGETDRLRALSGTLLITAFVAGLATLVLTPVTLKMRQTPPPRAIVASAVIVGAIPSATLLLMIFR